MYLEEGAFVDVS